MQMQAVYVPADDLTDPAPAASFAHLDATTVLNVGAGTGSVVGRDQVGEASDDGKGCGRRLAHHQIGRAQIAVMKSALQNMRELVNDDVVAPLGRFAA